MDKFTYVDTDGNKKEIVIQDDDLTFVQKDKEINDVKLNTKPTTFFVMPYIDLLKINLQL